jgi:hypothetical protein
MKNTLLLLAVFLFLTKLGAQITLEKEFSHAVIRKIIPNEGEKYAFLNSAFKTIEIYNADFTLNQSISFDGHFHPNAMVRLNDFSKNLFFLNDKWEFSISSSFENYYNYAWYNESFEEIAKDGVVVPFNDKQKLIGNNGVYSVPLATFEHEYASYPTVIKLSTGNYYQTFDNTTKTVSIYNEQHQLVKTFVIDLCSNCTTSQPFISDNVFNDDTLIEFYVTIYQPTGLQKQVIVNENGLELFTIQTAVNSVAIPQIAMKEESGLPSNKLLIYDYYQHNTKVYDLPSFSLENTYIEFAYTGNIGFKTKGNYINRVAASEYELYNANHEYYKSLYNFKIPNTDPTYMYFNSLSDSLFNFDANLEAIVNYFYYYSGCESPDLKSKLMSEDGAILFDFPPDCNCELNQLPNASTKIICRTFSEKTYIYGLPKPTVSNIEIEQAKENTFICVPNPIQGDKLLITLSEKPKSKVFARIYTANGRAIASFEVPITDKIEISTHHFRNEGLYFLEIFADGKRFVSKIQK